MGESPRIKKLFDEIAKKEKVKQKPAPEKDFFYKMVVAYVREVGTVSVSDVQKQFRIGYVRAMRIIGEMEEAGVIDGYGVRMSFTVAPVTSLAVGGQIGIEALEHIDRKLKEIWYLAERNPVLNKKINDVLQDIHELKKTLE